jgi:hypothetical protein
MGRYINHKGVEIGYLQFLMLKNNEKLNYKRVEVDPNPPLAQEISLINEEELNNVSLGIS